jgi:hypothetical protein
LDSFRLPSRQCRDRSPVQFLADRLWLHATTQAVQDDLIPFLILRPAATLHAAWFWSAARFQPLLSSMQPIIGRF